ncbi:MAG TPA: hypothetical protein EYP04_09755 [Anaerolineae bacterium]|nr:hypothetical protein [Anaerolineae bacterium]HIQ05444.1 hypothetical protein [Anaerolineae bacterium]
MITISTEEGIAEPVRIRQITITHDEEVEAVNELLANGWRLLHIGHTQTGTVYVLGKPREAVKRRAGFFSAASSSKQA